MTTDAKPWYHAGLKFQCCQCGDCCTGAPGYVWVNKEEIEKLASLLNLEIAEFERRYVRQVGIRREPGRVSQRGLRFFP